MSAASDYTETNILKALTGQATFPALTFTYIALHTSAPTESDGLTSEVSTTNWPSYARRKAEGGGAIGSGWTTPVDNGAAKESKNVNIMAYPSNNGAATIRVTHWSVWDALTGGNMLVLKDLTVPVDIAVGDIFVFDTASLTLTAA